MALPGLKEKYIMEEMTNEPQVDQTSQEPSTQEGEIQKDQNVESTETVKADTDPSESDTNDTPEKGNDGVDKKEEPANMSDREKSAVSKMHEATQEAAKYRKDSDAFQQLLNHPEFNEFLEWQKQRKGNNPPSASQPHQEIPPMELSEDDLLAAQTDPEKFNGLLNSRIQSALGPIANQALQRINGLERELALSKQERNLDAFGTKNPDFWEIDPRIMKAALQETKGQGVEAAYKMAKQLESQYLDKAQSSIQKKVAEKKKASSASPSRTIEPKVIYVDNENEANKVAFDNAKLGKRVDVRVKRKKT